MDLHTFREERITSQSLFLFFAEVTVPHSGSDASYCAIMSGLAYNGPDSDIVLVLNWCNCNFN